MSVGILISFHNNEIENEYLPISNENDFQNLWLPLANSNHLEIFPFFATGISFQAQEISNILDEFLVFESVVNFSTYPVSEKLHMLRRLQEIKHYFQRTDKKTISELFIG